MRLAVNTDVAVESGFLDLKVINMVAIEVFKPDFLSFMPLIPV